MKEGIEFRIDSGGMRCSEVEHKVASGICG